MGQSLKFDDGAVQFRQRLAVSILSHRPILIRNIRYEDNEAPGLREHEASFLRLLDSITNGTTVEINSTGTQLRFKPGVLLGGEHEHECPPSRSIGWFLEGLMPLAMFGKEPLSLTLTGVTDGACEVDPSPDYIAVAILPLLRHFGVGSDDDGPPSLCKVVRRGATPGGGGEVEFYCPIVKEILPIDLTDPGKIKRVRGTARSCRISPSAPARVAYSAKGVLHRLLPDVWIATDAHSTSSRGNRGGCGPSPGLGVLLTGESTTGVVISAECCMDPDKARGAELPEDLGVRSAVLLLEEIRKGGCVDTCAQSIALLLMCLGPEDVARIRIGTISQYTIASLRLFKQAFDIEFKVKPDHDTKTVFLSCLGSGYRNMAKAST
mmetsp:Transcript_39483/g.58008  ORF Transcript_39483/g.58008 Transcript_39483/m.58008 type:complete len:379 (-) Transcript_39483:124-1260(-)